MAMYRDNSYDDSNAMARQRDLVLSPNEFCFLQNKTNGQIKTQVGPLTTTISQQEALVIFDGQTKQFTETSDFNRAKQLFISAPEGWYAILKNPTRAGKYPEPSQANSIPSDLAIGTKVNIPGPISFALYPGQMAKVVRGHRLRSNQYLLARVYDADKASMNEGAATILDTEGHEVKSNTNKYFVGQLLIIKGTEISFYIPPTGIEVIPVGGNGNEFVRDAITLEQLEYVILKNENGKKRYVHGPAVVFPEPTETFVETPKGGAIFRALELSDISGIYVKVIAPYKDDDGTEHHVGEELFITGKNQRIYYPRPEHALIEYDGKYMHHAIAIPMGEGRYVLNRLTGEIRTQHGYAMYLPDPRTEVIVKRKLSPQECMLYYPGNQEALKYNNALNERQVERMAKSANTNLDCAYSTSNQSGALAIFEANANIARGTSYTKPRTITLDTKYDGVVTINVWAGYAINVVSKSGKRETVIGPATRLLDYDETLEVINPNAKESAVYLNIENNRVLSKLSCETKDFVPVNLEVNYLVSFATEHKDKWFNVKNFSKLLNDRMSNLIRKKVKEYTVQEFYYNYQDIIRTLVMDNSFFDANGMYVADVGVLNINIDSTVYDMLTENRDTMIAESIKLAEADKQIELAQKLATAEQTEAKLRDETNRYNLALETAFNEEKLAKEKELAQKKHENAEAEYSMNSKIAQLQNEIDELNNLGLKARQDLEIEYQKQQDELEKARMMAKAEAVKTVINAISPDLIAALQTQSNAELMSSLTANMAPFAMASNNESVADVTNKLLRGLPIDDSVKKLLNNM